eukprot:TRINITY_DN17486_c1_g1_i8.p3 TRINITY_DN17486_c1_g1~~TRINITY_DN17486_c1_g1_i8.p3  ORF type:complete len:265 (+),score=40.30 TRINITY_DN17486_c1_g1_i8:771-1565(+)
MTFCKLYKPRYKDFRIVSINDDIVELRQQKGESSQSCDKLRNDEQLEVIGIQSKQIEDLIKLGLKHGIERDELEKTIEMAENLFFDENLQIQGFPDLERAVVDDMGKFSVGSDCQLSSKLHVNLDKMDQSTQNKTLQQNVPVSNSVENFGEDVVINERLMQNPKSNKIDEYDDEYKMMDIIDENLNQVQDEQHMFPMECSYASIMKSADWITLNFVSDPQFSVRIQNIYVPQKRSKMCRVLFCVQVWYFTKRRTYKYKILFYLY